MGHPRPSRARWGHRDNRTPRRWMTSTNWAPTPQYSQPSSTITTRLVFFTEFTMASVSSGPQRARVNHFGFDSFVGQVGRRVQSHQHHLGVRNNRHVTARPLDFRHAQGNQVLAVRNFAARAVKHFRLNENHRVVVADGSFQQTLGVAQALRGPPPSAPARGRTTLPALASVARPVGGLRHPGRESPSEC